MIVTKRIYDPFQKTDGYRVLVDRLWPRGVSKEAAALDLWLKDIAPSPELRVWFNHEPERFAEFKTRYIEELRSNPAVEDMIKLIKTQKKVTLLYGARDPQINHAVVLEGYLEGL